VVQTCVVPDAAQPLPFFVVPLSVYLTVEPSGRLIGCVKETTWLRGLPGLTHTVFNGHG
jgi:hypothetical protein